MLVLASCLALAPLLAVYGADLHADRSDAQSLSSASVTSTQVPASSLSPSSAPSTNTTTASFTTEGTGIPTSSNASNFTSNTGTTNRTSSVSVSTTATASEPSQTIDPDIATIRARRLSIILQGTTGGSNISSWLSTLGDDGKWPDDEVDYTTGCDARRANWPASAHWSRLVTMAAGWHGGSDAPAEFTNSSSLLDAISRAMDFWFANDFTVPGCLDSGGLAACPCGTFGFWNTNWFSNIIGVPELVGETCLLVGASTLSANQTASCTHVLDRTFGTFDRHVNGLGTLTGANTLDVAKIGIDGGLLVENATRVADGYARIHREVVVQNALRADGIRADGSFGQHGGIIYNGNYGKDYTNDVLALEIAAAGTQYSAQNAGTGSQEAFEGLLQGDLWMIYRNVLSEVLHWDFSVLPRFISFPVSDDQATASIKINITQIEELGELWDSDVLRTVFDSLASSSDDANAGQIDGNRMFYANDYMVQRGPGYVSTLRMFSSRTTNTECVNSQNPFGFHLSDGTLYTYLQGNEYEDIAAAWDWNLIPGITTDYAATNLSCDHAQFAGKEAFVGGASDGRAGVAAMRYTNPFTGSLSFQKAWFFLDDDVQHVMIARADSNASFPDTAAGVGAHPIISVLDQKRLSGQVYVDGRPLGHGGNFSSPRSLWHDGVGYTFDFDGQSGEDGALPSFPPSHPHATGASLSVDFGARSGNWASIGISAVGEITVDLFSAWLHHAPDSTAASTLAYTVFPGTTRPSFARKSARAQAALRTVRNDDQVSAVYDGARRTAMVVFWEAQGGAVTVVDGNARVTVAASAAVVLLWRMDEGELTVADPAQSLAQVELAFEVGAGHGWRPKGLSARADKKTVVVDLPSGGAAGRSVGVRLD